jgi:hypothetical protein
MQYSSTTGQEYIDMKQSLKKFFKERLPEIWQVIKPTAKRTVTFLFVACIIAGAWYGFLSIVKPPPIDATPALIMVWTSVFVLLFSLFPNILDKVKKIKLKDFELELQETFAKATSEDYLSFTDFDDQIISTKGDYRNLTNILQQAERFPDKPVLLIANVRDGNYISIPMLFVYLFFLDVIGSSVTVLFVSSQRRIRSFSDIEQDYVVGAVSGKKIIRVFQERFPIFYRIYDLSRFNDDINFEDFFRNGRDKDDNFEHIFNRISEIFHDIENNRSSYISEHDVENWFKGKISKHTVELSVSDLNVGELRQALARNDDFILVLKDKKLSSVVSICFLTRDISDKMLKSLTLKKQ